MFVSWYQRLKGCGRPFWSSTFGSPSLHRISPPRRSVRLEGLLRLEAREVPNDLMSVLGGGLGLGGLLAGPIGDQAPTLINLSNDAKPSSASRFASSASSTNDEVLRAIAAAMAQSEPLARYHPSSLISSTTTEQPTPRVPTTFNSGESDWLSGLVASLDAGRPTSHAPPTAEPAAMVAPTSSGGGAVAGDAAAQSPHAADGTVQPIKPGGPAPLPGSWATDSLAAGAALSATAGSIHAQVIGGAAARPSSSSPARSAALLTAQSTTVYDQGYSITHDQTLGVESAFGVLSGAYSASGGPLTASVVTGPTHGTLTLAGDGSFTYVPNAGYVGGDQFTFNARDGSQTSNTASVALLVTDVAPTTKNETFLVHAGQTSFLTGSGILRDAGDVDDHLSLTAHLVAGTSHGSLSLSPQGSLVYTPQGGFVGSDTFTFYASDGAMSSPVATVTLVVYDDAPVATPDAFMLAPNTPLSATVITNDYDPNGDAVTALLVSGPSHGASFSLHTDGSFAYTPAPGFTGTDSFVYSLSDGTLTSNAVAVTLTVSGTPIGISNNFVLPASGSLVVSAAQGVLANDFDPTTTPLQAILTQAPASGTLVLNTDGSFTFTPGGVTQAALLTPGSVTFQYQARVGSSGALSAPATVTIYPSGTSAAASLQSVTFLDGQTLVPDNNSPPPAYAHWVSGNTIGDPVSYGDASTMTLQASFAVTDPSQFASGAQVQVSGGGMSATGVGYLDVNNRLVVKAIALVLPLDFGSFNPLQLNWSVLPNVAGAGFAWALAGASLNTVYMAGDKVAGDADKVDTTVADLATQSKAKMGQSAQDIVNQVWNLFKAPGAGKTPQVQRTSDKRVLTYWNDWDNSSATKVSDLLSTGDGVCDAWSKFFLEVCYAAMKGVKTAKTTNNFLGIVPRNGETSLFIANWKATGNAGGANTRAPSKANYPLQNTWNSTIGGPFKVDPNGNPSPNCVAYTFQWTNKGIDKTAGVPGQGNDNPRPVFSAHAATIFTFGNTVLIFDPSYGVSYSGNTQRLALDALTKAAVSYFGTNEFTFDNNKNPVQTPGVVLIRANPNTGAGLDRHNGVTDYP